MSKKTNKKTVEKIEKFLNENPKPTHQFIQDVRK